MLRFHVRNARLNRSFEHASGPIEFGRGASQGPVVRFVLFDDFASKCHARVTEIGPGRVEIENCSQRREIGLPRGEILASGKTTELTLPADVVVGQSSITIEWSASAGATMPAVGYETIALPARIAESTAASPGKKLRENLEPERLLRWMETLVSVQRAVAGSNEFYLQAAQALVQLVGMDQALVLLWEDGDWKIEAHHRAQPPAEGLSSLPSFSRTLVDATLKEKRTLYRNADVDPMGKSLAAIESVVASPIFGPDDEVAGVLYASRDLASITKGGDVGPLEAQVVQLLAASLTTGLARIAQEAEAVRSRVQFEQFFSRELSDELQRNPGLLEGRERDITVLFVDVRGFSRLAQRIEPSEYYRIAQDVLGRLTERVREHQGLVVDYTGDGLLAMWNAPFDLPDHAERAAHTAQSMRDDLPALNRKWGQSLAAPLDVGIGLSTGRALVGNSGAVQKLKYGPRGHIVNLGSRLETATKFFGVPTLVSRATRDAIGNAASFRRLGWVRLPGIVEDAEVFELLDRDLPLTIKERHRRFEQALAHFEKKSMKEAFTELRGILAATEGELDNPSFQLLARVLALLKNMPVDFNSAWIIESK